MSVEREALHPLVKGGVTYRIVTDHLGSVRLVVDAAMIGVAIGGTSLFARFDLVTIALKE